MPPRNDPTDALPLKPKPFLLLLALDENGPMHGFAIKAAMHERSSGAVSMDPGGLYRLIGRLERDGLVQRVDRPDDDPDERRQYVQITEWGGRVVAAEAARIAALADMPAVRALAAKAR